MSQEQQEIAIKLKSYNHLAVDAAVSMIIDSIKSTGAMVKGAIPLPGRKKRYVVTRSPHVDKRSGEEFGLKFHVRLIILTPTADTIKSLNNINLKSNVEITIKVKGV